MYCVEPVIRLLQSTYKLVLLYVYIRVGWVIFWNFGFANLTKQFNKMEYHYGIKEAGLSRWKRYKVVNFECLVSAAGNWDFDRQFICL